MAKLKLVVSIRIFVYLCAILFLSGICTSSAFSASCVTLEQYGGSGDGITDNSSAWSAAFTAIASGNGCIQLGVGTYKSSTAVNVSLSSSTSQSISIVGMGPRTTIVYFPSATDGFYVWMPTITNGFNLSGMTIATGQAGSSTGINISSPCFGTGPGQGNFGTGPQRLIDNVDFRGYDSLSSGTGVGNQYWAKGLQIVNSSFFNIRSITSYGPQSASGTGIFISGSGANCPALVYNINNANIQRQQTGIEYGNAVQGLNIIQSNFVLNGTDIACPSSSANVLQLTVSASQFDTTGSSIVIGCSLNDVLIQGNLFFAQGAVNSVILSGGSGRFTITGNDFVQEGSGGGNGVNVLGTASNGIISGNTFFGLSTGVILGAGSRSFSVQANNYPSTTTKVGNAGSGNVIGGGTP